MTEYSWATDEVGPIAERLIRDVEQHRNLSEAQILYVFRDVHAKSHGRAVLGRARKLAGLTQFLVDDGTVGMPLFVLEFPKDLWPGLKPEQKRALVDHELSHLAVEMNDAGEWVGRTRGHDVEEFLGVVKRNGIWKADVAALVKAAAGQDPLVDISGLDEPAPIVLDGAAADDPEGPEPDPERRPASRGPLRAVPAVADPFVTTGGRT